MKLFELINTLLDFLNAQLHGSRSEQYDHHLNDELKIIYQNLDKVAENLGEVIIGLERYIDESQIGMKVHYINSVGKSLTKLGLEFQQISTSLGNLVTPEIFSSEISDEMDSLKAELQAVRSPSPNHFPESQFVINVKNNVEEILFKVNLTKQQLQEYAISQSPTLQDWFSSLQLTTEDWISNSIEYFKKFGFFRDGIELDPRRIKLLKDLFPKASLGDYGYLDQILLSTDQTRVWDEDWEIWKNTEDEYKQAIYRWGEISRGAFHPESIHFEWDESVKGVFTVRFSHKGKELAYRTDSIGWIDPYLLTKINHLLSDTEICLFECDTGDQTAFVVALSQSEYEVLQRDRGWKCERLS